MITTEFGKEAPKAVAKFADKQAFKLIQNLDELQSSLGLGWRLFYRYPVANIVKNLLNFMNITKLISLRLKT